MVDEADWTNTSSDEEDEVNANFCLMASSNDAKRRSSDVDSSISTERRSTTSEME